MCFVLVQFIKKAPQTSSSWHLPVHLPVIPPTYLGLKTLITPHIGLLYTNQITSIATAWHGVDRDGSLGGAQTHLKELGQNHVLGVLQLMKQRGWKDYLTVEYVDGSAAPDDDMVEAGPAPSSPADAPAPPPASDRAGTATTHPVSAREEHLFSIAADAPGLSILPAEDVATTLLPTDDPAVKDE
jgi:hypothetical protein